VAKVLTRTIDTDDGGGGSYGDGSVVVASLGVTLYLVRSSESLVSTYKSTRRHDPEVHRQVKLYRASILFGREEAGSGRGSPHRQSG
jgi:hypothetical protein